MSEFRIQAVIILETSGERILSIYNNPKMFMSEQEELNFEYRDLPKSECPYGDFVWIDRKFSCFYQTDQTLSYYIVVTLTDERGAQGVVHRLLGWLIQSCTLLTFKKPVERGIISNTLRNSLVQIIESPMKLPHNDLSDENCAVS